MLHTVPIRKWLGLWVSGEFVGSVDGIILPEKIYFVGKIAGYDGKSDDTKNVIGFTGSRRVKVNIIWMSVRGFVHPFLIEKNSCHLFVCPPK